MTKGALVIGGSVAGLQAALDLAESGIHVNLVEESPFLGSGGTATVPKHLLNARLLEVAKHPNVTVWTNTRVNRAEAVAGQPGRFQVELRQHPRYVDLLKCTACGDCIRVCPVTVPGTDHKVIYLVEGAQPGCVAIDKLGKPPCSNTCPGGIHVQGYVALIAQGRFQEALDLIREAIPFPGICGRICTHPCEVNCRRAEVDSPVSIRALKRFVSDWELSHDDPQRASDQETATPQYTPSPKSSSVAVIGAGPAGMAVADRLARLGYRVTVFEKLPVIGGMMAVGIPEYRLPRDVIGREYRQIQDLGVEIRLNTTIGPGGDLTLDDLFATGYGAVCLAVGAHKSHELRISGEALPGVIQGIELLKAISLSQQVGDPDSQATLKRLLRKGPKTKAIVLGGGNTAMDVSRSLRRLGLKDVRIYYRRTRAEMPALPEEIEGAEQEGVAVEYLVTPVRILGNATTGVTGLECVRMKLGEPDSSGRRRPVPIADSEFVVKVDLVALAIGQATQLDFLGKDHLPRGEAEQGGIAITRDERINVDGTSFMTSRPGIFAAGDAVTADKMAVIEAIGMGKKAAAAIDAYLRGVPAHEVIVDAREVPIARRTMTEAEMVLKPRVPVPEMPVAERVQGYAEVELGYTAEQATKEAQRCLACGPCSECQACVRVCKPGAVIHEQHERFVEMEIGAVIYAGDPAHFDRLRLAESQGVYAVPPSNPLIGSAAAARAMFDLRGDVAWPAVSTQVAGGGPARIGVFVCQCGDLIAGAVDTEAVRDHAATWPDVVHAQVLPFSCSPEAARTMVEAVETRGLNRVVLAACSCCPIDQVCYSCTYQRVRCKDNLGMFHPDLDLDLTGLPRPVKSRAIWEFVNIREQCAWVHPQDRQAATAKATLLVAAAVAKARVAVPKAVVESGPVERSALILGNGASARACQKALEAQGIAVQHITEPPAEIRRLDGRYTVARPKAAWQATVLVLAPHDAGEMERLLAAFGNDGHRPRADAAWGGLDTHRPGVWLCDPAQATAMSGAAAAARVAAWLGRLVTQPQAIAAVVDTARCRACGTCVEICEFGAPQLIGQEPQRSSWIDPAICTGCGTCAAHCPSGAITAGFCPDAQLAAMLEAALA